MFEYIFVFLLLLLFSILFDKDGVVNKNYNKFLGVVVCALILLGGLRNGVGSDTHNYAAFFNKCPTLSELFQGGESLSLLSQPLWLLINSLVKSIWDHFLVLQFVHALVFNLLLVRFLKRITKRVFTSLLVIYCVLWWNLSFEVMRESICVVLMLNSLLALKENNFKAFCLWNIPSIFIHWFAFPIILLVLLCNYLPFKTWSIIIVFGIIFIMLIDPSMISSVIMEMSVLSGEDAETTIQSYLSQDAAHGFSSLNIFGLLMNLILVSPYLLVFSKLKTEGGSNLWLNLILLYVFLFFAQGKLIALGRYLNYLTPFVMVLMIDYAYAFRKKKRLLEYYFLTIMIVFTCYNGYQTFKRPPDLLIMDDSRLTTNYYHIPYTSIFEEQDSRREFIYY